MNTYQKTVLALGAVALILYLVEQYSRGIELSFVLGIVGMTVLIFFVLKNIGRG